VKDITDNKNITNTSEYNTESIMNTQVAILVYRKKTNKQEV